MKTLFLIFLSIQITIIAYSQSWEKHLPANKQKKDLTLFDYQKAFNQYWQDYEIKNGWYIDNNKQKQKAYGWKQFKRWEYYWITRVNQQTGEFPKTSASEEYKKHIDEYGEYKSNSGDWECLGTSSSNGGYSGIGRINIIEFHPTDDNIFWIGSPAGGLWLTIDAGSTWTPYTDNNEILGVSSIIIPSDFVTSNTIYIGTGDRDGGDNNSVGVLKSTNGGTTWNTTGLSFAPSDYDKVYAMLINPNNNQEIFAATSEGFYITTNGATDWQQTSTTAFIDIEFCPSNENIIYAASTNGRIYKSSDKGQNWNEMFYSGTNNRIELAVSQNQPNIVYAVAANSETGLHGIYKSTDFGENFNLVFDEYNLLGWDSGGGGNNGQGWYDLALAADPNNGNTIFCGGVNTWRSTDGGANWEIVNHWWGDGVQAVHADKHFLKFKNNTSELFECNDGGIYSTLNGTDWTDLTNGIIISEIYRIGVAQTDNIETIMGLQDNGSKVCTSTEWFDIIGGDGMECIIDYTNKNTQYGSLYYGDIKRTTNHWANNYTISNNIPGGAAGAWVTPYAIDPYDHNTLLIGYSDLWKTNNQGNSFTEIGSFGTNLQSIAIAPSNNEIIYVATNYTIYKTITGGTSWINITSGLPSSNAIRYISVKNNDANTAWLALSGYNEHNVYKTIDGGISWENISAGLPNIPVNCVIQNKFESVVEQIYAATDYGVYIKNGDNDWTLFSNNLPNTVVRELDIYYDQTVPENSRIKAGTFGRGLWQSDLNMSENLPPYVFTREITNITINSANVDGEIQNDFGSTVIESGIVLGTSPSPIIGEQGVVKIETSPTVEIGEFTISLSDLEAGTTYYTRAYAVNDNGTSYGGDGVFATQCDIINSLPWTNDIENNGNMPNCFTQEVVVGDEMWSISKGDGGIHPNNAHSGLYNLFFSNTNYKTKIIIPIFDFSNFSTINLSFWHTQAKKLTMQDELIVYCKKSESDEWSEIARYTESLFTWTYENIVIPTEHSDEFYIAFEANSNGGYGICIDDISIDGTVNIENNNNSEIIIYPNPTNGIINIILPDNKFIANLEISDITGKIIYSQQLKNKKNIIDLSNYKSGIYFATIIFNNSVVNTKFIIK